MGKVGRASSLYLYKARICAYCKKPLHPNNYKIVDGVKYLKGNCVFHNVGQDIKIAVHPSCKRELIRDMQKEEEEED